MSSRDVMDEIEEEADAAAAAVTEGEPARNAEVRPRGYDKRVVYGGAAAVLAVFIVFSFFGGSSTRRPSQEAPPTESGPLISDPPYASAAQRTSALRGDSAVSGSPIPPPSSAVIGGADGRPYESVTSSTAPQPPAGESVAPGTNSQNAGSAGVDAQSAARAEDPRVVAWRGVRDASPTGAWARADAAVSSFGGEGTEGAPAFSPEEVSARADTLRPPAVPADSDSDGRNDGAPGGPSFIVPAFTRIEAALVTAVNSDIPGDVLAQVTRDVLDVGGERIAIPAGTLLHGRQSDQVSTGQRRLVIAWTGMQLPDRTSVALPGLQGADASGAAGLAGRVSSRAAGAFGRALLLSALGAGFQLSQPQTADAATPSAGRTAAAAVGQQLAELSSELLRRDVSIRPTIRLVAGSYVSVLVASDLRVPARNWARTSNSVSRAARGHDR